MNMDSTYRETFSRDVSKHLWSRDRSTQTQPIRNKDSFKLCPYVYSVCAVIQSCRILLRMQNNFVLRHTVH